MEFWTLAATAVIIGGMTGLGVFWILQARKRHRKAIIGGQDWSREAQALQGNLRGLSPSEIQEVLRFANDHAKRKHLQRSLKEARKANSRKRELSKMYDKEVYID